MTATASGNRSDFRWLAAGDAALLTQVQAAFSDELKPEDYDPQSHRGAVAVKVIKRVGLRGNSALVVIGEKENLTSPYFVFRAFSFNLVTKSKSPVRGEGIEWFWMWRVEKLGHLTSAEDTDIIFRSYTCMECESEEILASFHYAPNTGAWELLRWSTEDGAGVMIGSHRQFGDDGIYYYDCLHAINDITGDGLDDVAVRCRERVDTGKPLKRVTRDETVLYTATKDAKIARMVIDKRSKYAPTIHDLLCRTKPSSPLCTAAGRRE
jgi:hypothetical protein